MCQFLQSNWKELIAFLIAAFSIWKYFDTKKNELAWRRTEFLFEQGYLLDSDEDISEAVRILEARNNEISLSEVFDENNCDYLHKFDKLFNLLDRLAYATIYKKTISTEEIMNFGWYLKKIRNEKVVANYCAKKGFKDILSLADLLIEKEQKNPGVLKNHSPI
jgi:hypothetical protein